MLEVLVGLFILAMCMLGNVRLQSTALKMQKSASFRLNAISLAVELAERMEANRTVTYALTLGSAPPAPSNCEQTYCTPALLAAFDIDQWYTRMTQVLPESAAKASISSVLQANGVRTYSITMSWVEPRGPQEGAATAKTETVSYTHVKAVI